MSAKHQPVSARCAAMRERLEDFAAGRLGPQAKGKVQGHLLDCQECAEVFGMMLMEQVATGELPELTPPVLPSASLHDRYLQARRPESSWAALVEALRDANDMARALAAARLEEIRAGLERFTNPLYARGAMQTRDPRGASSRLSAAVLTPTGEPSGAGVTFEVREVPRVTGDSHFAMTLATASDGHDGRSVVCTVTLPEGAPVSFRAVIERAAQGDERIVTFDNADLPIANVRIPLDRVALTIV